MENCEAKQKKKKRSSAPHDDEDDDFSNRRMTRSAFKQLQQQQVNGESRGEKKKKKKSSQQYQEPRLRFRDFTEEERATYNRTVRESGGFDVGDVPDEIALCSLIKPVRLEKYTPRQLQRYKDMSTSAIKVYNEEHETKYQFVKLIRINSTLVQGMLFYVTFEAKDDDTPQNFQARVYCFNDETQIEFCRVERKSQTT